MKSAPLADMGDVTTFRRRGENGNGYEKVGAVQCERTHGREIELAGDSSLELEFGDWGIFPYDTTDAESLTDEAFREQFSPATEGAGRAYDQLRVPIEGDD